MYTDKEKLNHFNDLLSSDKAQADFDLLVSLAPELDGIEIFRMEPSRYAEQILFHLLDFATREDIRLNRRSKESGTEKKLPGDKKEKKAKTEADKIAFAEKMKAAREAKKAEKEKYLQDTKKEIEQIKEELEIAKEDLAVAQDTIDELEDTSDELEQTKEALEEAEIAKAEAKESIAKLESELSEQKKST